MCLNILVDDHPMTVDSYLNLLPDKKNEPSFIKSYNCEDAYKIIFKTKNTKKYSVFIRHKSSSLCGI
jgi:hypothetical protein